VIEGHSEPITIETIRKAFDEIDIALKKIFRQDALVVMKYRSYFLPSEYIKEAKLNPKS
jgi:hypothetical protein